MIPAKGSLLITGKIEIINNKIFYKLKGGRNLRLPFFCFKTKNNECF